MAPKYSYRLVFSRQQPTWAWTQAAQASGPVEFHARALEFGEMGQFENLRGSVRGPGPQVVRAALQQPLRGQVHVMHQGFRRH